MNAKYLEHFWKYTISAMDKYIVLGNADYMEIWYDLYLIILIKQYWTTLSTMIIAHRKWLFQCHDNHKDQSFSAFRKCQSDIIY